MPHVSITTLVVDIVVRMILSETSVILFIEPKNPKSDVPVDDELTLGIETLLKESTIHGTIRPGRFIKGISTMGLHTCVCGANSESCDYQIGDTWYTNTLAVHYLRWHRDEVPEIELQKVRAVLKL